jgi:anti-sigma B factor antagonist
LNIEVRKHGRINIVEISGKLIIGAGDVALRSRLKQMLDAGERYFLFDMTAVSYMDSAGLGAVAACAKRARERKGVLKIIVVPRGKADTLFTVTGLNRAFEVYGDPKVALDSFAR